MDIDSDRYSDSESQSYSRQTPCSSWIGESSGSGVWGDGGNGGGGGDGEGGD